MAISSNGLAGLKPGVVDNAAARPSSPFEGQMVYEKDIDMLAIWNGTAWRYIAATTPTNGTVLQIVNATTSTQTANSTGTYIDTTLTVTITPKSSTSKIFVAVNQSLYIDTAAGGAVIKLVRDSTVLQTQIDPTFNVAGRGVGNVSFLYLDSPATTSATTYKTTFALTGGATIYTQINNNFANITAFEISA